MSISLITIITDAQIVHPLHCDTCINASMVFIKLSFTLLRVSALILAQDALCTDEISVS